MHEQKIQKNISLPHCQELIQGELMWTKTIRNKQKEVGFVYPPKPVLPAKSTAQKTKELAKAKYAKFLERKKQADELRAGVKAPLDRISSKQGLKELDREANKLMREDKEHLLV